MNTSKTPPQTKSVVCHSCDCFCPLAAKVDEAAPATAAGLLGCGVMAGIGAAINTAGVRRGQSVAVFGCGGVGDAAIAGAKLAGASTIIGIGFERKRPRNEGIEQKVQGLSQPSEMRR